MKVLIKLAIGALLLTLKPNNKPMGTSFIPFSAIIAVLIIAFLFAFLQQVKHKTRYRVQNFKRNFSCTQKRENTAF